MKKIKVLHIVGALNMGGAETMVMNIFRNIDRDKFQFDFYLSGNTGGYYEPEVKQLGGRIYNVGRRKKNPVKYCVELFKLIRREKYDVIQVHGTDAMDGLPIFVSWLAGVKKRCLFSHSTNGQSMRRQKIMRALFMPFVTHPQACSDLAAEWMYGKKASRAQVIPLPINTDLCEYNVLARNKMRAELNIADKKVIGHIGRFQTPKNHELLIDIFYELYLKNPDYRLILIGIGNLEEKIRIKVSALGLEHAVLFLGQVDFACKFLSAFDIFLLPSLYEGFPTVLLEAQANGLPSIASGTITPSIAITDLVHFVGLDDSKQCWVECLEKYIGGRHDAENYNSVIANSYSAKSVSAKFSKLYLGE